LSSKTRAAPSLRRGDQDVDRAVDVDQASEAPGRCLPPKRTLDRHRLRRGQHELTGIDRNRGTAALFAAALWLKNVFRAEIVVFGERDDDGLRSDVKRGGQRVPSLV